MFEILKRQEMADGTVVMNEISAPLISRKAKPGQFVILKANETGERIPLTMADTDPKKGTITIIYQVVGKSTALFKTLQVGDKFQDVIGPLGKPTDLENVGTVVCVGGGTGVAVVHPITRGLKEIGNPRGKRLMGLEDQQTIPTRLVLKSPPNIILAPHFSIPARPYKYSGMTRYIKGQLAGKLSLRGDKKRVLRFGLIL